jgi:putative cardiolipin synthase
VTNNWVGLRGETGPDGGLYWIERTASGEKRYDTDPGAGFLRRTWVGFLSILPIEREL